MNSQLAIDMIVEAKQHYNTNGDWTVVARQEYTAGAVDGTNFEGLTAEVTPDHAEDTVGGDSVVVNNTITDHEAIVGEAEKNLLG